MTDQEFEAELSAHRLHGEPLPEDLALLVAHRDELEELTEIGLNVSPDWAPWLDTSYLREKDWADPAIRANVKAIADVGKLIDFVIEGQDGIYFGYWRGPSHLPLADAPVVSLNSEGQFEFCGTANIAGAILLSLGQYDEQHAWFAGIGIASLPTHQYDYHTPDMHPSPGELHDALYRDYLAADPA